MNIELDEAEGRTEDDEVAQRPGEASEIVAQVEPAAVEKPTDELRMTFPVDGPSLWPSGGIAGGPTSATLPIRPTDTRARLSAIALCFYGATALVAALLLGTLAGVGWRVEAGTTSVQDYNALAATVILVAGFQVIAALIALVALLAWLHRFVRNAPILGVGELPFTPRRAVLYWFVPIGNWFLPYQVLRTLLERVGGTPVRRANRLVLVAWWVAWLVAELSGSAFVFLRQGGISAPALQALTAAAGAASFALAVFSIAVLTTLQGLADRLARRTASTEGEGASAVALLAEAAPPAEAAPRAESARSAIGAGVVSIAGAALVLVVVAGSVANQPAGVAWKTWTSSDGRFSASFPRDPVEKTANVSTGNGSATQHVIGAYAQLSESYAVSWIDFPQGSISDANSDAVLNAMAASISSTGVISKISLGSRPGREVLATMGDGTRVQIRVYLDGQRVYAVEVDDAKGTSPSADVQRFLLSFQIH